MRSRPGIALCATVVWLALAAAPAAQDPQPPVFKSGVELVMVDAQVVDRKGNPISGLTSDKFEVRVDGKRRKIVSVEFLDAATGQPRDPGSKTVIVPTDTTTIRPGNLYVLAVDQGSFRAVNAAAVIYAVQEFVKRLHPNDHLGLISFPEPGLRIDPTREHARVLEQASAIVGFSAVKQMRRYEFGISEAVDVAAHDKYALAQVVRRNCPEGDKACALWVEQEMQETVSILELQASRSLHGLREVVATVAQLEGRKTLVVVSAGIPSGDRMSGRLYMTSDAKQAADEAIASGVLLYTLHLNTRFLDEHSADGVPSSARTAMRDTTNYARGLDTFNGNAGGTMFEVNTGADFAGHP